MTIRFPAVFSIGLALRQARLAEKDFIKEAAAKIGYTERMIIHWEKGEMIPSPRARVAILSAYPQVNSFT
jgi:hypothetical protein